MAVQCAFDGKMFIVDRLKVASWLYTNNQMFQVTHPFHSLSGKKFEVLRCRKIWGEEYVTYLDAKGEARRLPLAWTSLALPDPFLTISAGRSMLHMNTEAPTAFLILPLARFPCLPPQRPRTNSAVPRPRYSALINALGQESNLVARRPLNRITELLRLRGRFDA